MSHARLVLLLAVPLVLCPCCDGQSAASEICGHISDPLNASVPGTLVEVRNIDTGIERTVASNQEGYYSIPLLTPGAYRVLIRKDGFRPVVRLGVRLEVNQTLKLDVALTVGTVTETVEVSGDDPLLQRATTELGTVIESRTLRDLPLNGRDFQLLLSLVPGVNGRSVNGQWGAGNLYHLDGVNNTTVLGATAALVPVLDTVQEFKLQSHNDKAEYGGVLGGIVNVVSTSGGNRWHGSAWEFVRNNVLDARDPFTDAGRSGPPAFRQNQFGAAFSGPVALGRLYDGRNRTFFSFGYEGYRYRRPNTSLTRVPSTAELAGDFSGFTHSLFDPATERVQSGRIVRDVFPGNAIPAGRISPTMQGALNLLFDKPNYSQDPFFNRLNGFGYSDDRNNETVKIDHQASQRDLLWARFSGLTESRVSRQSAALYAPWNYDRLNAAFAWIRSVSPDLLVESRIAHASHPLATRNILGNGGVGHYGDIAPLTALGFAADKITRFALPDIILGSPWSSPGVLGDSSQNASQPWSVSESVTLVRKRHELRFGLQVIASRLDNVGRGHHLYFSDAQTGDPQRTGSTGASLASALLGLPSQISLTTGLYTEQFANWSAYGQDEWRLTPSVTLNWGFRYDQFPSPHFTRGMLNDWDYRSGDWLIGAVRLPPSCDSGASAPCIPGSGSLAAVPFGGHIRLADAGPGIRHAIRDNSGPRAGVAWSFSPRFVLRAGYGLFFDVFSATAQDMQNPSGSWPDALNITAFLNVPGAARSSIAAIESSPIAALPSPTPWTTAGWFWDPAKKNARSQQWNIEVQRQNTQHLMMSAAYVGSISSRLDMIVGANSARAPGPGSPEQVMARKPFPYMVTTQYGTDLGRADYQAFQAKVHRVYDRGVQFLLAYSWSKSMDNGASAWYGRGPQDAYSPEASRGPSDYDRTHTLTFSGIYELPAGIGKRWFSQGLPAHILGGWQVNTITTFQSGAPFDLTVSGDVANIGYSARNYARPNVIGSPIPAVQTNSLWFNPSAFAIPRFAYGNFGRNVLRGPAMYNCDLSLFRVFRLRDRAEAQLRAEAFNAFNLMNPGQPDNNIGSPNAGRVTSIAGRPRDLQLGFRVSF